MTASWSDGLEGDALRMASSEAGRIKALSGPGTGKTYVTMRRVQRLLQEGADPGRIMAVTLTRTAAEDLKRSLAKLGVEGADRVVARTLHSHCFSILRRSHVLKATRVVPRILAAFETTLLLRDLDGDFGDLDERRRTLRLFAAAWSDGAQGHAPGEPVEDLDQRFQDELIRWLRWHRGMLLEELVPQALRYLRLDPLAPERGEFEHVLVDEYQDLNRADQAVVELLSEKGRLSVVGDDDQSIYGFRFAFPDGIRDFAADEEVQFMECRRCPGAVVRLANALVGRNVDRSKPDLELLPGSPEGEVHHVRFATAEEEADAIAEFIDERISAGRIQAGDCLVLVNSRRHGRRIRAALLDRGIPAESFFREEALDTEAAREALSLLTLRLDPADRVALRVWLGFDSPDGRTKAYRRLWRVADEAGADVSEVLEQIRTNQVNVPHSQWILARWIELKERLAEIEPLEEDPAALVEAHLPEGDEELASLRAAALLALEARGPDEPPAEFPSAVRYQVGQPDVPFDANFVRVMSLHRSKGLTARLVAIAGLVEGLVPKEPPKDFTMEEQRDHAEEQRRLLYVGITRSSDTLVLSSFGSLPFAEAKRYGVTFGGVARRGDDLDVRTIPSPLLAELGPTLPPAVAGDLWKPD